MAYSLEDEFGDIIGKARRGQNMSQKETATAAGISESDLSNMEKYTLKPTETQVYKLAEVLNLDGAKLLSIANEEWQPEPVQQFDDILEVITISAPVGGWPVNAYLLICKATDEAAIIDTAASPDQILKQLDTHKVNATAILLTHSHNDHTDGLPRLQSATKCPTFIHKNEPKPRSAGKLQELVHSDVVNVGELEVSILDTPGHTPHLPPFLYAVCVGVCVYRNKLESLMGYGRIPPYKIMSVKNRQGGILMKYTLSWVHPRKIITGFRKVFNGVCIKKPTLRNFYLMLQAVCVAPSFRIQSIASHLPIRVKHDKSKQKRVLRFIDTYFPVAAVKGAWLSHIVVSVCRSVGMQHLLVLIDETDLPGGWKAIVAALPFRNRAIPLYWVLYKNEMLKDGTYQGHNDLVQQFCCDVHSRVVKVLGDSREPVLVFDRGFARARAILKFFEGQGICYLMRVPRNVGVRIAGNKQCLEEVANGFYPQVLYHYTEQVPVALYVGGQHTKKDPLYLISNRLQGNPLRTCYKRRTQIEHGFRDLKTNFGFKALVLRKNEQPRMEVLFLLAVVAYGLAFLCYEKAADRWAKTLHPTRKVYSVISVINRMIREVWTQEALLLFTERTCLRDINFLTAEGLT